MRFTDASPCFEHLLARMEDRVLVLTLNRPQHRNAFNSVMESEFYAALKLAEYSPDVSAVVLGGAGPVFSAGHDMAASAQETAEGRRPTINGEPWIRNPDYLPPWTFSKPFAVAAAGYVGPFANAIAMTSDFLVAAPGTRFSFEQVRMATGAPFGQYTWLMFLFPPRVAFSLWTMGGWMDAQQAHALHYVERIADRDEIDALAIRWAQQAATIDPAIFAAAKIGMRQQYEMLGISDMVDHARRPPALSPQLAETHGNFYRAIRENGLRAALELRDDSWDPELSKI
jgi:enoyl-CoA hydratase